MYEALFNELALELELAELSPLRQAASRFDGTLTRLRWTNRELARTIAISARDATYLIQLRAPDLCTDIATAKAARRTPATTSAFLHAVKTHSVFGGEEVPTIVALLKPTKPYRNERGKAVAELRNLDARYQRAFANVVGPALAKLLDALLSAPPS